jgi:nicotinate-nucleotide pyrophosphorylase (carboxylating)
MMDTPANGFTPEEAAACQRLVEWAFSEDLGVAGDRTSRALIAASQRGRAAFVARSAGIVAGLPAAALVGEFFSEKLHLAEPLAFHNSVPDGAAVAPGAVLATIEGSLRGILAAERTALNFLQRLSGIATLTRRFVDAAAGSSAQVLDTRKTAPGWRVLEKYAVRQGGGANHRRGLHDGILIKDNHLAGFGGDVQRAVETARSAPGNDWLPVEVEVDTLEQLDAALAARADIVLLDNMPVEMLREAVARRDARSPETKLEASGGVTLATIGGIAATGVERISIGAITHSAPALDIALDYLK